MKTWTGKIAYDASDHLTNEIFTKDALFFDIETTGFSAAYTSLYLIGCAHREGDFIVLTQFFAETPDGEADVLGAFFALLSRFSTIVTFHGQGFDIPYLAAKCKTYGLPDSFDGKESLDLFKEVSRLKFLLHLPDYKQKTVESFLNIGRGDTFHGGELIDVYKRYVLRPNTEDLLLLKLHNYEDVLGMTRLLPILAYKKFLGGNFSVTDVESRLFPDVNGVTQKELILTLTHDYALPRKASARRGACYLVCGPETSRLSVRLFDGALKYFLDSPENYYYLPAEDTAVPKDVAASVDPSRRKRATKSTCYVKKDAIFVPQYETVFTPAFRENYRDKNSYFELTSEFLNSPEQMKKYVMHFMQEFYS